MAIYPMRVCFGAVRGGGLGSHIYDAPKEREERSGGGVGSGPPTCVRLCPSN